MCTRAAIPRDGCHRLASADVGAANARLGSTRIGEVLLEILLAEPHRAAYPQVWQTPRAGEFVDGRDREPQQLGDFAGGKELVVEPNDAVSHERFLGWNQRMIASPCPTGD